MERTEEIKAIMNQFYTDFNLLNDDPDWCPEKGAWGYSVEDVERLHLLLQELGIMQPDSKLEYLFDKEE